MELKQLITRNRSYRRFFEEYKVGENVLLELVDLARRSASGANLQSLKYLLATSADMNTKIFSTLGWAGYLKDWPGPEVGERPAAYIVMVLDHDISKNCFCDHGIAAQSILLGAVEQGLGGCIFQNIDKQKLREQLKLDERYEIMQVIALGKPKEEVRIVPLGDDDSIRYYRDEAGVHYVPKRSLEDIVIG